MWMRADTFIRGQMFGMATYAAALHVFTYFLKNVSHASTGVEVEAMRASAKRWFLPFVLERCTSDTAEACGLN